MDTPSDVVGRVGRVLRAVSTSEPQGVSTSDVARVTGLARPTTHRLLSSLLGEGLVDRDDTGRWLLGPELYFLGTSAATRYDVTQVAQPFVRALAEETGESAFFSARRGDETVCLIREDGSFPLRSHVLFEGARFPLGVVSAGLVILAHLDDREVDGYLGRVDLVEQFGPSHRAEQIRERIAQTRLDGYGTNPGLVVEGSWGMAAAVFDHVGSPRWALTLTGVTHRFDADRRKVLGARLLREAHSLGRQLDPELRRVARD